MCLALTTKKVKGLMLVMRSVRVAHNGGRLMPAGHLRPKFPLRYRISFTPILFIYKNIPPLATSVCYGRGTFAQKSSK